MTKDILNAIEPSDKVSRHVRRSTKDTDEKKNMTVDDVKTLTPRERQIVAVLCEKINEWTLGNR